ncbi:MAG: hypothetical protein PHD32_07090 [Eubacteriales bacterium]|nr:hypothetical protein [Eubacteriales bacterium]
MLPVITVNSQRPGLLLVNGVNAGEVDEQEWITMPLPADGRCYLHFLPADSLVDHCSVRFFIKDGVLSLPDDAVAPVTLVQWPSLVHEITFYPRTQSQAELPLAPETLAHLAVGAASVSLLRYGTLWVVVEQGDQTLLASALPAEAVSGTLSAAPGGFAASGQTQNGQWGALFRQGAAGWEQAAYEAGDEVRLEADGSLRAVQRLDDMADHRKITVCRAGQAPTRTVQKGQSSPLGREDTAKAFLQACSLEEYAEATGYLSGGLRAQVSGNALREFVGEVYTCGPARFCPPVNQEEAAVALFRKVGEHTLQAYPLAFRFVEEGGTPRIDDIRPL